MDLSINLEFGHGRRTLKSMLDVLKVLSGKKLPVMHVISGKEFSLFPGLTGFGLQILSVLAG